MNDGFHYFYMFAGDLQHLQPLNVILGLLGDQPNALQDVGDVIDASFLDVQHLGRPVEINHTIWRLSQQVQKAFGGEIERRVIARFLCGQSGNYRNEKNIYTAHMKSLFNTIDNMI